MKARYEGAEAFAMLPRADVARHAAALLRGREMRAAFFGPIFVDRCWDILLLLASRLGSERPYSVHAVASCAGSSATGLRKLQTLEQAGLVERTPDDRDRRRAFITLSPRGEAAISRYLTMIARLSADRRRRSLQANLLRELRARVARLQDLVP